MLSKGALVTGAICIALCIYLIFMWYGKGVSDASLVNLVSTAIGSVTLVVTLILTCVGLYYATGISQSVGEIGALKQSILKEREEAHSLRALSASFGGYSQQSLYCLDIIHRYLVQTAQMGEEPQTEKRREQAAIFEKYMRDALINLERFSIYIKLVDPKNDGRFSYLLDDLISKYADKETLEFLDILSGLVQNEDMLRAVKAKRAALAKELVGFDPFRLAKS